MEELKKFYESVGFDAQTIVVRLGGSEALVRRFLSKFPSDGSMNDLRAALDADDTQTAFRAAHTLKGVCANLGIESLRAPASDVTELLRAGNLQGGKEAFPSLQEEYDRVLGELKALLGE